MTQMSHTMSTAGQLMSRRLTIRLATLATSFMTTKSQHRQRLLRLRIRLCHCHHLWLCATHSATIHLDCDCHSYRVPCAVYHAQEDKVVQMYETMMTRHSTMLVGPTGGGKSVVINALVKAQCHMGLPTKCVVLNPKVSGTLLFV